MTDSIFDQVRLAVELYNQGEDAVVACFGVGPNYITKKRAEEAVQLLEGWHLEGMPIPVQIYIQRNKHLKLTFDEIVLIETVRSGVWESEAYFQEDRYRERRVGMPDDILFSKYFRKGWALHTCSTVQLPKAIPSIWMKNEK
jgi:hypothetical protein